MFFSEGWGPRGVSEKGIFCYFFPSMSAIISSKVGEVTLISYSSLDDSSLMVLNWDSWAVS